jgi:diadenosine tetraphosphatase ApaH/serine/threonine PP2A family protein phosphatase
VRYFVLTDIHGNAEALDAVVRAVPAGSYDRLLVLGDLVGYGADPNAVIDRVRALKPAAVIRGNHDKVAAGIEDAEDFNLAAREAALWTAEALTPVNRDYLAELPSGPVIVDDGVEIFHGSPDDEDAYIFENLDALRALKMTRRPVAFFGHTHLPIAFVLRADLFDIIVPDTRERISTLMLDKGARYLVNPGSVGQPRDGDARAAYALYDSDQSIVQLCRVPYAVDAAQVKIRKAGLPEGLAHRLGLGR